MQVKIGGARDVSKRALDQVCGSGMHVRTVSFGRYTARPAESAADLAQAVGLRNLSFRHGHLRATDADRFDAACSHVLIHETNSNRLVCCYRVMLLADARDLHRSYAAQFYDLSRLAGFGGPMLELGRFCVHPGHADADILRLAWGALAGLVDLTGAGLLFGCSSFDGARNPGHDPALVQLLAAHLAPDQWRPLRLAPQIDDFAARLADQTPNPMAAMRAMPPLLRSYLAIGGWVSDHAVIDADLDTLHVFTAVEIANIPAARARALRAISG